MMSNENVDTNKVKNLMFDVSKLIVNKIQVK